MFNAILIFGIILLYFFLYSNKRIEEKTRKNMFLAICFLLFFILVGFRSFETGNDTKTYVDSFNNASTYQWEYLSKTRFEPGFTSFEVIISHITNSSRIFLLILSGLFNYGVYRFIKKYSKNYFLSVIMYVCLLFFYFSMTGLRQFFAIIFVLYSFRFIKAKQLLPFLFLVLIATCFHTTSIVCLLLYPMYHIRFSWARCLSLVVVSLVAMIFLADIADNFLGAFGWGDMYTIRNTGYSLANLLYFLVYISMFIFSVFLYKIKFKTVQDEKEDNFYLYVLLASALINLIAVRMNVLSRLADYFAIFSIIALPNIVQRTCNCRKAFNVGLIVTVVLFIYSTTIIVNKPEWNSAYNYTTCLLPDTSYECKYIGDSDE